MEQKVEYKAAYIGNTIKEVKYMYHICFLKG